jgi:ubiquinone/menaquinone biosynthesis C-methylase UbiE
MRTAASYLMIAAMNTAIMQSPPSEGSALWAHTFAAIYEPFLWLGERRVLRELRKELLAGARGCTVDIGSGTGLNLPLYPDELDELVLAEPDAPMRSRLEKRRYHSRRPARLVDAPAERLPFPDGSVDTVVSTLVLCTVDDPALALHEIARVLRPDGQLLFIEHVLSHSPRLAAWQNRLAELWRKFARGCHCNRDTMQLIASNGFTIDDIREETWRAMPPIVRPLIIGRAQRNER